MSESLTRMDTTSVSVGGMKSNVQMTWNSRMSYAVLDVETTIQNNGHPFTKTNVLCVVGLRDSEGTSIYDIEYGDDPYGPKLAEIKRRLEAADFVVGHNIKFDLHWIRRYIPDIRIKGVFDTQLAEFILSGQVASYPSLNDCSLKYGFGEKIDRVAKEYWDLGIDTKLVPWDLLAEYTEKDVDLTDRVYNKQRELLKGVTRRMFWLQCEDLLLLQEMEWNGLTYDLEAARVAGQDIQKELETIDVDLRRLVGHPCVNLGSDDHLSVVLYGGTIYEDYREQYTRTLKDGTVKEKSRWAKRPVEFRRMVSPLRNTEVKPTRGLSDKELTEINRARDGEGRLPFVRHWSVAEPTLSRLPVKGRAKEIVGLILRKSRLEKLDSTYYTGLVKKHESMGWERNMLHGQLNQCVARTGRLSSSEPNEQNFDKEIKRLFPTRYEQTTTCSAA